MDNLIAITKEVLNDEVVNTVNSREVYAYLEVCTKYSMWIQRAIEKYGFVENEDYILTITLPKSGKREYIVTLDMAKELCMISNTPKGNEARKYFIRCEKELNKPLSEIEMVERHLANLKKLEAVKQEKKALEITLDKAEQWSSIKKQEFKHKAQFNWRDLKRVSKEDGYEIKKVFDQNYGYVNSYHADVWLSVYGIEI